MAKKKPEEFNMKWDHMYHGYPIRKVYTQVLGLRGSELLVYSIIHSFSENNNYRGVFCGSAEYIADMTGLSRTSVLRAVSSLADKNYIICGKTPAKHAERLLIFRANFREEERLLLEYITEVGRLTLKGKLYRAHEVAPYYEKDTSYSAPNQYADDWV